MTYPSVERNPSCLLLFRESKANKDTTSPILRWVLWKASVLAAGENFSRNRTSRSVIALKANLQSTTACN